MQTYLDCIPCFFKQALFAAKLVLKDDRQIKEVLDRVGAMLPGIPMDSPPPETARRLYHLIREYTGVADPFASLKEKNIMAALAVYPELKQAVRQADNPLELSVRLAVAGNVIDFGANPDFQMEHDVKAVAATDPAIDHFALFSEILKSARTVLYLGDNAGETVFDKILIETLDRPVVYAVRSAPIINDATLEDARKSGLNEVATLLSSGCDAPGFLLNRCSKEFLRHFQSADLVISKGQGNWESLSREVRPIFYLLKAKCSVIAEKLNVHIGDTIIGFSDRLRARGVATKQH